MSTSVFGIQSFVFCFVFCFASFRFQELLSVSLYFLFFLFFFFLPFCPFLWVALVSCFTARIAAFMVSMVALGYGGRVDEVEIWGVGSGWFFSCGWCSSVLPLRPFQNLASAASEVLHKLYFRPPPTAQMEIIPPFSNTL